MTRRNLLKALAVTLLVPFTAHGQNQVVLYGTSWCPYCKMARDLFDRHGIVYKDYDIERNRQAYDEYKRLGGAGVPLIVINGKRIYGYDEKRIKNSLGLIGEGKERD